MDILLGDDANGFDLLLGQNSDISLATSNQDRLWNAIKIALFTADSWAAHSLLGAPLGSSLDRLVRLPVNEQNRKVVEQEMQRVLSFVMSENMAKSLLEQVIIVDRKRYSLRLTVDGRQLVLDNLLEVRE